MQEQEVIYTSSDGKQTPIKQVETTHLINSLAKEYREIFNSQNSEEFSKHVEKINQVKQEIYARINEFHSKLGE